MKKKKINLGSFGAGITAGGLILAAGVIPSLFKGEEGSLSSFLISIAIIFAGIGIHKKFNKKDEA